MSRSFILAVAITAAAVVLFACNSGGGSKSSDGGTPAAVTAAATSTPVSHASEVQAALPEYVAAFANADEAYQVAHLHRTALNFYGQQTCNDWFASIPPDPTFAINVQSISGPASWTWVAYDETIATIPDAYTLHVTITQGGVSQEADVHFQWNVEKAELRGFSPCVPRPA